MNLIGKRVRVKGTTTHPESKTYVSLRRDWTGTVTQQGQFGYEWEVDDDEGQSIGAFYTDELIVLGGRHAGEPHPQNFEDAPVTLAGAEASICDSEDYGKHTAPADWQGELNAWREHRDAL